MNRIDAHCHLFNRSILDKRILLHFIKQVIHSISTEKVEDTGNMDEMKKALEQKTDALKRIVNFLRIGFQPKITDIIDEMQTVYRNEYALVPLMFDLYYCFDDGTGYSLGKLKEREKEFYVQVDNHRQLLDTSLGNLSENALKLVHSKHEKEEIFDKMFHKIKDLVAAIINLNETRKELKDFFDELRDKDPDARVLDHITGYQDQIIQITELKTQNKYKNLLYPFFAVDPRRPDILKLVKEYVGKGKPFIGVKLYTPNGYSPTDPILFSKTDEDCVYKYCSDNSIPLIAHCTDSGFASLVDMIKVSGDIYKNGEIKYVENEQINFEYNVLKNPQEAIQERSKLLNHPTLWEQVVIKYPNLKLNLAHFGGKNESWTNTVFSMMHAYENLYTDLSCHADEELLQKIKLDYYDKATEDVKNRFLYGSDFYLLMMFTDSLDVYKKSFITIFKDVDFDKISISSPKKFLNLT